MPSCSLSDVVKATAIDQATVRGIIERLKTRLLIEIAQDTADRRKVSLALSPSGADLVEKTIPFAERITQDTFGKLNSAERVAILYLLRKMSEIDENE
jgi:DNA-binding MarR family transcriptional regulator